MVHLAKKAVSIAIVALIIISSLTILLKAENEEPLYVAIIWHQHQPFYENFEGYSFMPWVRLHAAKDYFKMAWLSELYPNIHTTIDLTGSLLIQLQDLMQGKALDQRYLISRKIAEGTPLTVEEKWLMLQTPGGFFDINWNNIVYKYARYLELKEKRDQAFKLYGALPGISKIENITSYFTDQDYVDLAAMFNLYWMSPLVVQKIYPELWEIWDKGKYRSDDPNYKPFTREELAKILNAHIDQVFRTIDEHKKLQDMGIIEVITTPYTHPLSPLLVDFGWEDDLRLHVEKGIEIYKELFGVYPYGMWPPEEALNEKVLKIFSEYNIVWTVTDPRVAAYADSSFLIGGTPNYEKITLPYYVDLGNGKKIYVFFRDWVLSDKVSFQYSGWNPDTAVEDFIDTILSIRDQVGGGRILVIALDGENAWEHYPNDATEFLTKLYERLSELQSQGLIKTVTITEYLEKYGGKEKAVEFPTANVKVLDLANKDISMIGSYENLPYKVILQKFPEGSWAGGDLSTWIGEPQENKGWMYLKWTRDVLYEYISSKGWSWMNPDEWDENSQRALEALLRAEGSDWFWWYGSDQDSGNDKGFDSLFKYYLRSVFECLGLKPPEYTLTEFFPDGSPYGFTQPLRQESGPVTPKMDGNIESDEWSNATAYLCAKPIDKLFLGADENALYVGVMFSERLDNYDVIIDISKKIPEKSNLLDYMRLSAGFAVEYSIFNEKIYKASTQGSPGDYGNYTESWNNVGFIEIFKTNSGFEAKIPYESIGISGKTEIYVRVFVKVENDVYAIPPEYPAKTFSKTPTSATPVFVYEDPEGDDHGPGTYTYPKNNVFVSGAFDLLRFEVYDLGDSIEFAFKFKELGDNPWNGPNGFSLQIIEVYIDTLEGEGSTWASTGSNVEIAEQDAWEIAIRVA
ncbi:MAG: amylopullulanase, partial [Thermoplasmata archaeon]